MRVKHQEGVGHSELRDSKRVGKQRMNQMDMQFGEQIPHITSHVIVDDFTREVSKAFDYDFTGESIFIPHRVPIIPKDFGIGVVFGSSGSGKSTLIKNWGKEEKIEWDDSRAIISHFSTPQEAIDRMASTGLNSIPTWCKPYAVLSTGEKFRADLARRIRSGAIIDEFTSVVNREVAKSASRAMSRYIQKNNIRCVVISTCHSDVLEWLEPDWTYNTDTCELKIGRYLQRPPIVLDIYPARHEAWNTFAKHHYLTSEMNPMAECFIGVWEEEMIAFSGSLPLPGRIPPLYYGDERLKYRESRLVVLPDFQGLGIGVRFSNAVGDMYLRRGRRYFSKTAHIRMGEYRTQSPLWRNTSTNLKSREKSQKQSKKDLWHHMVLDTKRICYSHEYIGQYTTEQLRSFVKETPQQIRMEITA